MVSEPRTFQPSLFGVAASDPTLADLAGLLAGPGTLRRMGGTAQVAVQVDAAWRVHALMAEFADREIPGSWEQMENSFTVRTAFTTRLLPLAADWSGGSPSRLHLNGHALRLWVAAGGSASVDGYLLPLGTPEADWPVVGGALSAAGLTAELEVTEPGYRISGQHQLDRLAELVGQAPSAAPPGAWPR